LVQKNTLLIYDISIQLRELIGILDESIFPLRSHSISAFAPSFLHLLDIG
jgi:hypothetical protein